MRKQDLFCGIDIHYKNSFFCILNSRGENIELEEIPTDKDKILQFLTKYKKYKIQYAFEAGGMANYINNILSIEKNTKNIHVVHPYKFKIISESKHKNDKQDSIKLAKALLKDFLPCPVHIKSNKSRHLKTLLNLRRRKVNNQTRIILQSKGIVRGLGIHPKTSSLKSQKGFITFMKMVDPETYEYSSLEILKEDFLVENEAIKRIEKEINNHIENNFHEEYKLLTTIPGIGFITAATIISIIDTIDRFSDADQLSSYLGVVPSERSSGDKIKHGRITKEGSKEVRSLLIQSAWTVMRMKKDDERLIKLRKKFYRISMREKKSQKAIVPIARHLTRIIYGVLKSKTPYSGEM